MVLVVFIGNGGFAGAKKRWNWGLFCFFTVKRLIWIGVWKKLVVDGLLFWKNSR
jgi:hypothetical protein